MRFLMIVVSIFLLSSSGLADEKSFKRKNVVVSVKGKQYESFKDYKLDRLRQTLVDLKKDHPQENKEAVLARLRKTSYGEFSSKELIKIINEIYQEPNQDFTKQVAEVKETDLEQKQKLLDQYFRKSSKEDHIVISPDKMKTIVIKPQS